MFDHTSSIGINQTNHLFNGKELQRNEFGINNGIELNDFGARMQDMQTARWLQPDPLARKTFNLSSYLYCVGNPIKFIDPNGKDTVVFFDQANNPNNKRVYTAQVFVVKSGRILGPYSGSTFPNNASTKNTLKEGWYDYNNQSGHKAGTQKGLNIIDDKGERNTSGINPQGEDVTMTGVNIHSGVKPENNNGLENRGSAGCPTIDPSDANNFFNNFSWTNTSETTGTSTGQVGVYRGETGDAFKNTLEVRQALQNPVTTGTQIELNNLQNSNMWNGQ